MHPTIIFMFLSIFLPFGCGARNNANYNDLLRFRYGRTTINFEVNVEVFYPRGLRIFIPHKEGLEMFSIHGKVNSPFSESRTDVDTFADDILVSTHGMWVYENEDIKLQVGDILNFWIFLQYRGAGQRFNDLSHAVKKLSPSPFTESPAPYDTEVSYQPLISLQTPAPFKISTPLQNMSYEQKQALEIDKFLTHTTAKEREPQQISTRRPTHFSSRPTSTNIVNQDCECNANTLRDVWTQMNATVSKMRLLEESFLPLEEKLQSLTETVTELIKNMNVGTNLLLTGNLPVRTNPVEDVRYLLIEKLKLFDLSMNILQAEYTNNGIAFEMASPVDKLRILKRSNDILSRLSYKIIDPNSNSYNVRNG